MRRLSETARRLRRLYQRHATDTTSLYSLPFRAMRSDLPDLRDAVRWIGRVDLRGTNKLALLMRPNSSARFALRAGRRAAFRASVAIGSEAWAQDRPGVEFRVSVRSADGRRASAAKRLAPRTRFWQRRWIPFSLDLSAFAGTDIELALETAARDGAGAGAVRALWGDPVVSVPRPLSSLLSKAWLIATSNGLSWLMRRLAQTSESANGYHQWVLDHEPHAVDRQRVRRAAEGLRYKPEFDLLMPVRNPDHEDLKRTLTALRAQIYPRWDLCLIEMAPLHPSVARLLETLCAGDPRLRRVAYKGGASLSSQCQAALAQARGDYVAFLEAGDIVTPDAFFELAAGLQEAPRAPLIFSDEDTLDNSGHFNAPFFKPGWSPERFASDPYLGRLCAVRRERLDAVGGVRAGFEAALEYDVATRVCEGSDGIQHVAKILCHRAPAGDTLAQTESGVRRVIEDHIRRTALGAEVEPGLSAAHVRLRYRIRGSPKVSIIIPTRDKVAVLRRCVESVVQGTDYRNFEITIVDNGSMERQTLAYLSRCGHKVVSCPGPFNFSRINNVGVAAASGEHLLFLNNDTVVINPDWLRSMLEYSQQGPVGAVGAKLYFPDGRLQHIGVTLQAGNAGHVFYKYPGDHPGYLHSACVICNYSAVTAACMMTRRDVFDSVGGFDERFPSNYNDVDLCLRIRESGRRIVWTPYARLYHYESTTRDNRGVLPEEQRRLQEIWTDRLHRDPYFNPTLSIGYQPIEAQPAQPCVPAVGQAADAGAKVDDNRARSVLA